MCKEGHTGVCGWTSKGADDEQMAGWLGGRSDLLNVTQCVSGCFLTPHFYV